MRRVSASARNRLRQQEDWCDQMAAAQLRLVAIGRRPEMMAMFHSVPRDQWLETTIADIRAHMGLLSSPQLQKFTKWFLFLAHLQHRLVGVTDNSKVLNYFAMLLPRSLRARWWADTPAKCKCETPCRRATGVMTGE